MRGHYIVEITLFVDGHQLERLTTLYHVVEKPSSTAAPAAIHEEPAGSTPESSAADQPAVMSSN